MSEGGVTLIASGTNLQIAPRLQFSPEKNALFAFWTDTDEGQRSRGLSGQKMSPTGVLLWGDNGRNYVELSHAELLMITPRLTGGNIVVFYTHGEMVENENILETRGFLRNFFYCSFIIGGDTLDKTLDIAYKDFTIYFRRSFNDFFKCLYIIIFKKEPYAKSCS